MDKLKILIVIVDRKISDKISETLSGSGARLVDIMLGKGTAKSEIVSLLGLGETEKAILVSSVTESKIEPIYEIFRTKFNFNAPGKGVAFTVPVSAVGGPATLRLMMGEKGV